MTNGHPAKPRSRVRALILEPRFVVSEIEGGEYRITTARGSVELTAEQAARVAAVVNDASASGDPGAEGGEERD